jgi:hypothetical protein
MQKEVLHEVDNLKFEIGDGRQRIKQEQLKLKDIRADA